MAFLVVHFLVTDDVSVASNRWLNSDKTTCLWPPYKEVNKVKRAVLEHKTPDSAWMLYEVAVLGSYPNYLTAEIQCRKALDTSSLNTDESDLEKVTQEKTFLNQQQSESSGDETPSKKARRIYEPTVIFPLIDESSIEHTGNNISGSDNCETNEHKSESLDIASFETEPTECEKKIIEMLDEVMKVQREHSLLLRQLVPTVPVEMDSSFMPKLPAESFAELDEWEAFLHNPTTFKCAVHLFGSKVGTDVGQSTRRLLSNILTNKLASNFNWAGSKPKKSFKELKTVSLILCALKENLWLKDASIRTVENAIKDWLKHAPFRQRYIDRKKEKGK